MAWTKGQSGNPKGRRSGVRERINHATLKALGDAWRKYGPDALARAAQERPAEFAAIYARLLPKDTQVNVTHGLSEGFLAAIRNANDQRALRLATHTSPSVTVINGSAEHVEDEPNALIPLDTQRNKD